MDKLRARECFVAALDYVEENHPEDLEWYRGITPEQFDKMSCKEFLESYLWVVYAAGFKADILQQKIEDLETAFCDLDIDRICQLESPAAALAVIAHKLKAGGFLKGCRLIRGEGFDVFKARMKRGGIDALEELPGIGPISKKHLARNIGLADVVKDDVWLVRVAKECGTDSVDELASFLAGEFKEKEGVVDLVLWFFCKDGGFGKWRMKGSGASAAVG